jgi:predicted glycosyltransferase
MIRFECLDEDIFNLVKKFPELNNLAIPRTKKSDKKYLNYRDYFTNEEWIDWVSERSLNVIKKFKYEF